MKAKKTTQKPGSSTPSVDLAEVERLLEFMNDHGLEECEYSRGDLHIRLRKPPANPGIHVPRMMAAPEIVVAEAAPAAAAAPAVEAGDLHIVKSPIVGTFYEAPSPGAAAFVKIGDTVEAGQTLCIIEAMKLMNEIETDAAGEIVKCHVSNGQPVEYGEVLFSIRRKSKK